MKYEEMKIENLRPCMILANFITDEMPKYSYEDYLRDFVNQSPHFLKKSEGKLYQKPKSEANGECDCVSNTYSFDFKLLVSQNRLQADRIFTAEISLIMPGVVLYGPPRISKDDPKFKEIMYIRPWAMFRTMSMDKILEIAAKGKNAKDLEKEVAQIIRKFETKKNLLMFFPYNFNFPSNNNFEQGKKIALQGLNLDFNNLLHYRFDKLPQYDTYIAFIYEAKSFVIAEWTGKYLECVDTVSVSVRKLFCDLMDYSGKPLTGGV